MKAFLKKPGMPAEVIEVEKKPAGRSKKMQNAECRMRNADGEQSKSTDFAGGSHARMSQENEQKAFDWQTSTVCRMQNESEMKASAIAELKTAKSEEKGYSNICGVVCECGQSEAQTADDTHAGLIRDCRAEGDSPAAVSYCEDLKKIEELTAQVKDLKAKAEALEKEKQDLQNALEFAISEGKENEKALLEVKMLVDVLGAVNFDCVKNLDSVNFLIEKMLEITER